MTIETAGFRELKEALGELGIDQFPALVMASNRAVKTELIPELVRTAPVRTGALQDSFKSKAKSSRSAGTTSISVGADPNVVELDTEAAMTRRVDGGLKVKFVRPARYLHLVEKGHSKRRGGGGVRGSKFMEKAMRRKRRQIERAFINALGPSIEKRWRTLRNRAAKKAAKLKG